MKRQGQELLQQSQEAALQAKEATAARPCMIQASSRSALVAPRSAGRDQGLRKVTCGALNGKLAADEGCQLSVALHPLGQVLDACHQVLVTLHKQNRSQSELQSGMHGGTG